MSESMAFIGGVAIAGLAALVMFRPNIPQPNLPISNSMQPPQMQVPGQVPQPYPIPAGNCDQQLKAENEQLKNQVEQIKNQNEQFKGQITNQQFIIDSLNTQLKNFAPNPANQVASPLGPSASPGGMNPVMTNVMWAAGGMGLTVGGGILIAGIAAMFSRQQRSPRTIQVIHPNSENSYPLVHMRRSEFLPPRVDARRVEQRDYDRADYDNY